MTSDDLVWLDLGLAIYRRRMNLGIHTQRELAERAGVNPNTISRLELGVPWVRRGRKWAAIEAALELPTGWIERFVSERTSPRSPLVADAVEQAVLDAITEHAPAVTIRQARAVAKATVRQLEQAGLLPGGARG